MKIADIVTAGWRKYVLMPTTVAVDVLPDAPSPTSVVEGPQAANAIRILIAEDRRFVADALQTFLTPEPGMLVVGTFGSGADSLGVFVALRPDVVLLEFRLSDDSAAFVRTIHELSEAKVIFITHDMTERVILAAIELGASAVLNMSTAAAEVVHAVRTVAEGGTLISARTIASVLNGRRKTDGAPDRLTLRERQVLRLMSQGTPNREIARQLGISYSTVRSHIRNVAGKLAAHSKLEVLVTAQRLELVEAQTATSFSLA